MDIFYVWEVLRVEGERLSRFSLLLLRHLRTPEFHGVWPVSEIQSESGVVGFYPSGAETILIPSCLEIGTAKELRPIRTQKKDPEHYSENSATNLTRKAQKSDLRPVWRHFWDGTCSLLGRDWARAVPIYLISVATRKK